jgi:hypothetical protein
MRTRTDEDKDMTHAWTRWLNLFVLSAALVACGGGGGGSDGSAPTLEAPPTTAATLQASGADAQGAAQTAIDSARRLAQLSAGLSDSALPVGSARATPAAWGRAALSPAREQALARQTLSCSAFLGTGNCTGSVVVDTNFEGAGSVFPPGTYVTLTFNGLTAVIDGESLALDGGLRVDYPNGFDPNATTLANLRFQLTLDGFAGSAQGVSFGPLDEVALYEYDSQGVETVTIDGLRITGFDTLTLTDADNYALPRVTVRRAHWSVPATYVDLSFTNWTIVDGRPAVGGAVSVTAGNGSASVDVVSRSADDVVYTVRLFVGDPSSVWTVTAAYPAGGGAPSYTVVPAN